MEESQLSKQLSQLQLRNQGDASENRYLALNDTLPKSTASYPQIAGVPTAVQAMRELIGWPQLYQEEGKDLGVRWLRGVLLHGPPGCGKTLLVMSVAAEVGASVHTVLASNIFGAYTGESEEKLRNAFEEAHKEAAGGKPTVIFLDEVDALCPRRDAGQPHESRVVAQLLTLLDGAANKGLAGKLFVVAATNRPNAVDPALRRAGRLDREIAIPVPASKARQAILEQQTQKMPLAPQVNLAALAAAAVGYSGADLAALCREAALTAMAEQPGTEAFTEAIHTSRAKITEEHFSIAMKTVRPSITRGSAVELPPVQWEDIGGLSHVKLRLKQAVEWPIAHAQAFQRLGLAPPRGVLLHGPPGCCKTTLARAAATASGASLQALTGSQLFSAVLGEGEALLRAAFQTARAAAPAIIFLDELDSLASSRGPIGAEGIAGPGARLLSTLLTEMDGMELAQGILVLAATNRPEAIDSALLRPGRFDVHLYVPPPDAAGRLETLKVHCRNLPLASDVNLQVLASSTERYTGAELEAVCREAALAALREDLEKAIEVCQRHFETALVFIKPDLTDEILLKYESWQTRPL